MLSKEYRNSRFLVVEGNVKQRLALERLLNNFGAWFVDLASDGAEAIAKCEKGLFDVVICDYQLNGRNGQQVLEELRYRRFLRHTSLFILTSAETTKEMVLAAIDHQPDAYMNKPILADVLKQRLDALLVDNEVLYETKHAMDMERWKEAISRCEERIAKNSHHSRWCQKTVAEIYLRTGQYEEARRVYNDVMAAKPLIWAQVGLARVMLATGELENAESLLRRVIETAPYCLVAYDMLAEIMEQTRRLRDAQAVLTEAVTMSPLSIRRHGRLGHLSWINQDMETAAEAFRNAVEMGRNSVFDCPDYHFGFARALCERAAIQPKALRSTQAEEALAVLNRMKERFSMGEDNLFQEAVISARAFVAMDDQQQSESRLREAERFYSRVGMEQSVHHKLEYAQVLLSLGKEMEAEFIFSQLCILHGDDADLMRRIEELRDEPVSAAARQKAAELNKTGIQLFQNGDVDRAIGLFNEALEYSPHHPALNLNLTQVLLRKLADMPLQSPTELQAAQACLQRVARIKPNHKQYARYQHLQSKWSEISQHADITADSTAAPIAHPGSGGMDLSPRYAHRAES